MNARAHALGLSWCSASLQFAGSCLAELATSRSKESSRGVQVLGSSGSLGFAWQLGFGFRSLGKVVWWKESKGDVPESRYLLGTIKACSV